MKEHLYKTSLQKKQVRKMLSGREVNDVVCEFDRILAIPSVLTSITALHLPFFSEYLLLSKCKFCCHLNVCAFCKSPCAVLFSLPF